MGMIPRYCELRALSDEELISRYDKAAENTVVGTGGTRSFGVSRNGRCSR
jgi:hypothetical protein